MSLNNNYFNYGPMHAKNDSRNMKNVCQTAIIKQFNGKKVENKL